MPTGYQIVEQSRVHYLTFQVVYWIDVFSRREYRDRFLESLAYCRQHKSLEVYGYVIMTNHIHLLVRSAAGNLSGAVQDYLYSSARNYAEQDALIEIDKIDVRWKTVN